MDNFVLSKGTKLYRGVSNINHLQTLPVNEPMWVALTMEDALNYGNIVVEYHVTKEITLINPMDKHFHIDYTTKLNKLFTGKNMNGVDDRKFDALIPFGLPSYDIQITYLKMNKVKLPELKDWGTRHELAVACIDNKHRYSAYHRDKIIADLLRRLYSNYDGYMTNIMWPSKLHDGFFNKEVCVFNPIDCLKQIKIMTTSEGGGKKKKDTFIKKPKGDSWNRMNDPRLFDPKEKEKIEASLLKGGLSDLAKEMLGLK